MFDVTVTFMVQLSNLMPVIIILYVLFDFLGSLFFGRN